MSHSNDPKLIQISIAAIAKMVKFDIKHQGKETAGLLIGHEENGVVFVEDVRLGEQKGNAVHVEVSEAELTQAAVEISERTDGKVIVGWIHTHPNLSAFLSVTDIETQSLYQAFMPNAIAIVMDPAKYAKTKRLDDLDLKVFRVENNKAKEFRYIFSNTVEFGLNTFVHGEYDITSSQQPIENITYQVKVPSRKELRRLKIKLSEIEHKLNPEDIQALESWLDLTEAMESGDIKEVPVEVERIIKILNNSLGEINDNLQKVRMELEYRKDLWTLLVILIGVGLQFGLVFLFWYF